jgi:hypothetical protein
MLTIISVNLNDVLLRFPCDQESIYWFLNTLYIPVFTVDNRQLLPGMNQRPLCFIFERVQVTFFFIKSQPYILPRMGPRKYDGSIIQISCEGYTLSSIFQQTWNMLGAESLQSDYLLKKNYYLFYSEMIFTCRICLTVARDWFLFTQRHFAQTCLLYPLSSNWACHHDMAILSGNRI